MTAPTAIPPKTNTKPGIAPKGAMIPGGSFVLIWVIILKSAVKSLIANKLRSILAMLGIIIGIAAVIAMLAMGAGAQEQVTSRFQSMGTNLLFVRPAQRGTGGVMSGTEQNLTVDDALEIAQLPGVGAVSPVINGSVQAKYMDRNNRTTLNGVSAPYFHMRNFDIDKGRQFSEVEAEGLGRVVVIGPNVAKNLFGDEDPIDKMIKLNNINFRVVGVTTTKGDQGWNNPDDQALIPYTTAMKILFGLDYLREVDIAVADGADIDAVSGQPPGVSGFGHGSRGGTLHMTAPPLESVTALLRKRHRLTDLSMPDDFIIQNQAELLANLSASISTFRILLGTIASISLLVGGIGIMNIMLVTVTERTREIGIRKAIGAKFRDILSQFIVEAIFMSGVGGLVGALLGIGTSLIIGYFASHSHNSVIPVPIVDPLYVILSVTVSGLVGVVFGVYPAYRAAQLDPIEALRYE